MVLQGCAAVFGSVSLLEPPSNLSLCIIFDISQSSASSEHAPPVLLFITLFIRWYPCRSYSLTSFIMVETRILVLTLLSGTLLSRHPITYDPGFAIEKVASLAQSLPSHSWEYGAAAEALLELHDPLLSVFGPNPFPVQASVKDKVTSLAYAASKITFGEGGDSLAKGGGAVADPASLGVSAVMLGKTIPSYAKAADATVDYLLNSAPRYYNGAISHRAPSAELW